MTTETALIPRSTIVEIEGLRTHAMKLFGEAQEKLTEAMAVAARAAGGTSFSVSREDATKIFMPSRTGDDCFIEDMRKRTDRTIWQHLLLGYGFERLMDRQAMDEFRAQLETDPPEVTTDMAQATFQNLLLNADKIFRRGVANAFASLDRRFRSHDGFKIGERIVLTYAFNEGGLWNHHSRREETIRDIERAFYELDGREMPERYAGIVGLIDAARSRRYERTAFTVEDEYFRFRAFKNGNAHLWFKRDDLLESVNKLLAAHYGEVLGAGSDAVEEDPFAKRSTAVARNMGWFPTPSRIVSRIVDDAGLWWPRDTNGEPVPKVRILEPSAGLGAIARGVINHIAQYGTGAVEVELVCVELEASRAEALRAIDGIQRVVQEDFLSLSETALGGKFDRILMNPPFDRENDVDHVIHAFRLLAPGGKLVAVMAAGVEFRQTKKSQAFRALVERHKGEFHDLPIGSFEESGTGVNTCIVTIQAPAAS